MAQANYLIGRGELLVDPVRPPPRKPSKEHPYNIVEASSRLAPQLSRLTQTFTDTPLAAAPDSVHVAKFALHPTYIAKSYYPGAFFAAAGLEPVGSRPRQIRPAKHTRADSKEVVYGTSEIFVAGRAVDFENLATAMEDPDALPSSLGQIIEIEEISSFAPDEKTAGRFDDLEDLVTIEAVLHLPSLRLSPSNRASFLRYAADLGFEIDEDLGFEVKNLWFLPGTGPAEHVDQLAAYSTMRVVRPMPTLSVSPSPRSLGGAPVPVILPSGTPLSDGPKVAILDGGLPDAHPIRPWVESYRAMNDDADNMTAYEQHGLAVASAFLFGPLHPDGRAEQAPCRISVFRVLDSSSESDDSFELYRTLGHVEEVLLAGSYDFVNLSLGPTLPVEDTEVHAWTAVIDDLLSDGDTMLTVAVGNNGEHDRESGNARIQVPSDAVNALAVGSATTTEARGWDRAPYSAVGPGRMPGVVKPDILAFGGSPGEYFHVLREGSVPTMIPESGTSLSAPYALRQAAMLRSLLGSDMTPLAIRALLIHAADRGDRDAIEVGWGKVPERLEDVVITGDGTARILYKGELKPGKYVRAAVPIPLAGIEGMVTLRATFCFATPVDVQSPDVYTRAGLEVRFRPDIDRIASGSSTPKSRTFFSPAAYADESRLRSDDGKWETVLHAAERMRGTTLANPVFDIHYNARDEGGASRISEPLKYALVITLHAPRHVNLHADVLAAYPNLLVPIEPQIGLELGI